MNDKTQTIQFVLLGLFVSILVASNAGGSKLIAIGSLTASATVISYALSFLITDVVSEVYGAKVAGKFVWVGFIGAILSVLFFMIAVELPPASFYTDQAAFEKVFGTTPRILIGGFTSFLISQLLDVRIFHYFKRLTKGKYLWLRNNASTLISQFIDSCIFITIAFYGVADLIPLILGQYLLKVVIAICDTPLVYVMTGVVRRIDDTV